MIATGWPTNGGAEYRPTQPITRDAMAAFLYRFHTNVSHAGETPQAAKPQPAALDQIAHDLLTLVNREREAVGAHRLAWNDPIAGVSESWAGVMLSQGRLYHNPTYSDQYPSGWSAAAENIAQNYWNPGADAAAALMDQWMNSSGHKANILNPRFTHIGVGLAVSESGDLYACQNSHGTNAPPHS